MLLMGWGRLYMLDRSPNLLGCRSKGCFSLEPLLCDSALAADILASQVLTNTDPFSRADVKVQLVQNLGSVSRIFRRQLLDGELSTGWPVGRRGTFGSGLGLVLNLEILLNTLQAVGLHFQLIGQIDPESDPFTPTNCVESQ